MRLNMNTAAYLIVLALIATALYFGVRWLVRECSRYRGPKSLPVRKREGPQSLKLTRSRVVTSTWAFLTFDWKTAGAGHWKNSADRSAWLIWT